MALPDVFVKILSAATPRTAPTNTGVAFAVGNTTRGPEGRSRLVRSLNEFLAIFGERIAAVPSMADWVETYFNEGGAELYFARVFGSGAKAAELKLKKGAETVATVSAGALGALDPGTWGNTLFIVVEQPTGSTFRLKVEQEIGGVKTLVEETPTLSTVAELVAWAKAFSNYISVAEGKAEIPDVLASKVMSGGTTGAAIADADYTLALANLSGELGPGQVAAPGQTVAARQLAVIAHAVANNRYAVLDATDTATVATLVAQAQALYNSVGVDGVAGHGRRWGELNAPWEIIPGLTPTTARTVPPSARKCAAYNKIDELGNPNVGAAGRTGMAVFVNDLSQPAWTNTQREELNNAGVTVSRRRPGGAIATWGIRTLADQSADEQWSMAPNVRTVMAYAAEAFVVGEEFDFEPVDGFGETLTRFKAELVKEAAKLYAVGALFGDSVSEAFAVNTGPSVNTPSVLAAGKLLAQVQLRTSPVPERVEIFVIKISITQSVS